MLMKMGWGGGLAESEGFLVPHTHTCLDLKPILRGGSYYQIHFTERTVKALGC